MERINVISCSEFESEWNKARAEFDAYCASMKAAASSPVWWETCRIRDGYAWFRRDPAEQYAEQTVDVETYNAWVDAINDARGEYLAFLMEHQPWQEYIPPGAYKWISIKRA